VHFCREEPDEGFEGKPQGDALDIDEELWAYSLDAPPNVPTGVACKSTNVHCANDREKHLFWVWPNFVSMQDFFEPPGCGSSMLSSLDFSVQRLEELDRPVTLTAALGRGAEERMKSAFDKAKLEEAAGQGPDCVKETTFDTTSWHITRAAGAWRVEGWANTQQTPCPLPTGNGC
jgi:hypothetical protein